MPLRLLNPHSRRVCRLFGSGGGAVRYETSNLDDPGRIKFDAVNSRVFVVNGMNFFGNVIAFSHLAVLWRPILNVPSTSGITRAELYSTPYPEEIPVDAFLVFKFLQPKPEILLFGAGDFSNHPSKQVKEFLKANGISLEVTSTLKAISTFNMLNTEDRRVAGAFLLPRTEL
jgi:uncharacterized protein